MYIDQDGDATVGALTLATIYVCITCQRVTNPEDAPRPGLALARATARAAEGTRVTVRQVRCLANCNRALSAAIRCDNTWTYVFGGLDASVGSAALVEGAQLLASSSDGLMPWSGRPVALKRGLIGRTPPIDFPGDA